MKLVLEELQSMVAREGKTKPKENEQLMKVLYCGVCKTDAKMFFQGHRDLLLPRVLGHEIVVQDGTSEKLFVPWPGKACGSCNYCLSGKENLCDQIKIMGFNSDGGFQEYISIDPKNLIPLPKGTQPLLAAMAEPLGCVINAFEVLEPKHHKNILIYGGGTLGLMAAITAAAKGIKPHIVEKNEEKIKRIKKVTEETGITYSHGECHGDFDAAINTCSDPSAYEQCINKLNKGGTLLFFSGLTNTQTFPTEMLNLIHYKSLNVKGSYGLTKKDIVKALDFIKNHDDLLVPLIEKVISPFEIPSVMESIIKGKSFKYIVDFTKI